MLKAVCENFLNDIPKQIPDEIIESVLNDKNITIERIISKGHFSPPDQFYDQDKNEWIILIQGQAVLSLEDPIEEVQMNSGDYLLITAHRKHRVEWTRPDVITIWLAIHF